MISTRLVELVIDTVVCLTLVKWETVAGQFGGYLTHGVCSRRNSEGQDYIFVGGQFRAYGAGVRVDADPRSLGSKVSRRSNPYSCGYCMGGDAEEDFVEVGNEYWN